jgi:hypothetical protein
MARFSGKSAPLAAGGGQLSIEKFHLVLIDSAGQLATNGFWVNRKDGFLPLTPLPVLVQHRRCNRDDYAIGARRLHDCAIAS